MSDRPSTTRASFQFRLFIIFTILSLVSSFLFITLHIIDKAGEIRRHASKEVLLRAGQLADSVRLPLYAEDRQALTELARRAAAHSISRVTIWAADGRVMADIRSPEGAEEGETIGETVHVLTIPAEVVGMGPETGTSPLIGTVRIERGTEDLKKAIHRDIAFSTSLALLFWLAVSWLSYVVLRRTTRSFQALVEGVEAMKGGDYTRRIRVLGLDEPGKVAVAINELAETLQRRDRENRSLTRDLVCSIETEVQAREELAALNRSLAQENCERLHAERSARQSEQTLRTLMDIMPVGVVLAHQDGEVEYVNEFMVEWIGYRRKEMPTMEACFSLLFPDAAYRESMMAVQRDALERCGAAHAEAKPYHSRITCRNGEVRHVLLSNQLQGGRLIMVLMDVTDREMMQEQLIKVQKLESLGILAGGIAHNFNNALTGVMGFISLARCKLDPGHQSRSYLQLAEKASLRAAGMARELLTFASGGAPVKRSVSLHKVVEEVVSLALNASNVGCRVEIPERLPAVKGDEGQLVQALSNILINARQAMPEGGTVTVRAGVDLGCCPDAKHAQGLSYLTLVISDEGHGISEEDLPKIFDPYFSTKETTGLGLSSVHSIVYRHGGHVSVASQLGVGTTFTICLPATGETAAVAEGSSVPYPPSPAEGAVLVMDDDAMVRDLSGNLLAYLGYRSVACAEGSEAVKLYRSHSESGTPFFAVILDLTVPGGMGGVEAAREILAFDPQANLIVSSGYSYDPVMAQHKRYGFRGAVAKPYKAEQLAYELSHLQQAQGDAAPGALPASPAP